MTKFIILAALIAIGLAVVTAGYGALNHEPKLFEGGLVAAATSIALAILSIALLRLKRYLHSPVKCLRCGRDIKRVCTLGEQCHACIRAEKHDLVQLQQTLTVFRRKLNEELTAAEQDQQNELYHQLEELY